MAKRCMSPKGAKWALGIGIVLLVVSLSGLFVFPTLYNQILKKSITLTEGSMVTKIWEDIPLPLFERLYFFNITNGDEFVNKGEPLNVTEVGPYTYSGKWVKRNPVWNSNGTVSYRETRTYQFEPNLSRGRSQDDVINTLNGPMIIGASMLKNWNIGLRILLAIVMGIEDEKIIIQKTIRELVYEGYEDPIIKYAPVIKPDIPFKNGRFSWLYGMNATDDGLFTVFTGADDESKINKLNNWNGNENLNFWKGDSCNMLNGTTVETGPPLPDDPESYTFFQSFFCRSLTFNYTGDNTHYGMRTKRFVPTSMVFANGTENPDNACFEVVKERPSGVLDVSPCQFGAPVILSFPHFHMADPSYLNPINGLSPNVKDHGSYLEVEPMTGVSADMTVRFQLNVQIERVRGVLQFADITEGIFPILWAELQIAVDEDWAKYFQSQMNNPKIIAYTLLGVLMAGSLALIISALVVMYLSKKDDDDDPLIDCKDGDKKEHDSPKATLTQNSSVPAHMYGAVTNTAVDVSSEEIYSDAEQVRNIQEYPNES